MDKKNYLKMETEGLLMAAQNQALQTIWIKINAIKISPSALCRMRVERDEMSHIVSECWCTSQKEYKKWRYDRDAVIIPWNILIQ